MGKKKSFIDKKHATTYSLVYRSQEDVQADPSVSERTFVPAENRWTVSEEAPGYGHEAAEQYPSSHPLAWLHEQAENRVSDDARRREIVSLGLPDDGYDYLKHLRVVGGKSTASLERQEEAEIPVKASTSKVKGLSFEEQLISGPSVFVPATKDLRAPVHDVKTVDASKWTVHSKAEDDDGAELVASGITAISREVKKEPKEGHEEIDEVAAALSALEMVEDEGAFDADALDDDFILQATHHEATAGGEDEAADGGAVESESEDGSGGDDDEEEEEEEGIRGYPGFRGDGVSLASSYWRKERTDRKELLAAIDERFERLAFQYDEDQIGDLDEEGDDIAGVSDINQFGGILDEFIEEHRTLMPGSSGDPEKDEEVEARELTKRLVSAYDEEGEPPAGSVETMVVEEPPVEKWDCESILSLRSNLDNHPRCISEPRRGGRPFPAGREKIELSAKTGLPINRQSGGATAMSSDGSSGDAVSIATSSVRRKDESREEKKARKAAVKEAQRQARARKKDLKQMFKDQESKMKGIQETRPTVPLP